ncbi:unnamed protein product [Urochloa humidicola]
MLMEIPWELRYLPLVFLYLEPSLEHKVLMSSLTFAIDHHIYQVGRKVFPWQWPWTWHTLCNELRCCSEQQHLHGSSSE